MKNISLTQLGYALSLEETRHFGLAAKKCHVTQPTLSMQIQKLEDELGVILFDRSKQPVMVTSAGAKVLEQARLVMKMAARLEEIVHEENGEVSGEFRLGIIPTLAPYFLPLFIPEFTKKYPAVNLILDECMTDSMIEKLKRDQLDGGVLATPLHEEGILETPLFYEPFWIYVSDHHPLYKSKEVRAESVHLNDLWLLREGHCFRGQVLQICQKRPKGARELPVQFESGNLSVLKSLVDQDLGLTLLPDLAVRQLSRKEEKLRVKPIAGATPVREVSFIQAREFTKERVAKAVVEIGRSCVPQELRKKSYKTVIHVE